MALLTYNFASLVSNIAAATQASARALLDYTVGSTLRAVAESTAGVVLWLQAIILQLLTLTRASTSVGADLDSWMADFDFDRLPASAASGLVTFSRFTSTQQAVVPAGATVQTTDGTQAFAVTVDTTISAWDAGLGGYVIPANTAALVVPVAATAAGTGGNVRAGTITQITGAIQGVDTVTNASAFLNGVDAESDPSYRRRFVLYLASLSKATEAAIGYAVRSVQQGIDCTISGNQAYDGSTLYGYFTVVVDDGTGHPPGSLLDAASLAVDAVRGLTIRYGVFAPVVEAADVSMALTSAPGHVHGQVIAAVAAALQDFIDGLKLGDDLPYSQLAAVAYSVPGVINATSILLNGGTADLAASSRQKILCGTLSIS